MQHKSENIKIHITNNFSKQVTFRVNYIDLKVCVYMSVLFKSFQRKTKKGKHSSLKILLYTWLEYVFSTLKQTITILESRKLVGSSMETNLVVVLKETIKSY